MAATYVLEVDWDNNGVFTGTGEDITARTLRVEFRRGRDYASQLTGRSTAGRLLAALNNESGDYSSFNASSPIFGNILPGRKVRLRTTAPSAVTLWTGFLLRLVPDVRVGQLKTAHLEAIGPLGWVNQREVRLVMATNELTGTAIGRVLDAVGWPAGDRTIDAGQTTMARFWTERVAGLAALRSVEDSESGFLREGRDGKIIFEDRQHRLLSPHTVSQATFSDAAAAARPYLSIAQEDPLGNIFNDFQAEVPSFSVGSLAVMWVYPWTGANSPLLAPGESRSWMAEYPTPDAPTDAVGVDAWTTPVASTDYLANSASDGSGTDLTASVAVAATKYGQSMKITLTNNHASTPAYITLLRARGTPVTAADPVVLQAEDATSQTAYGKRSYPSPGKHIPDPEEALDWANYNLGIYKDPIPLITLTLHGAYSSTILTEILTRDLSERVTVVAENSVGLGINQDFFIEAEQHMIMPGGYHVATYLLSPAEAYGGFWVLDVSELGFNSRVAY